MKQLVLMFCSLAFVFAVPALAIDFDTSNNPGPVDGTSVAGGGCPCPIPAQPENEPVCSDGYIDAYNGGCNSSPPVYSTVVCSPICGETGVYTTNQQALRDTDWYRLNVVPGNYSVSGTGDGFRFALGVLTDVCPPGVIGFVPGVASCTTAGPINFAVGAVGTVVIFASKEQNPETPPCGSKYTLNISGPNVPTCQTTPVEPSTWGNIKATYQ